MTPDAGAQPGELSPADGSGASELLRYRSAQGRWVVAAMILGSSVAGIDSTVVVVALPAIGRNLHVGFQDLQWTVTSYTLTLASLILLAGSLSDRWGRRRVFLAGLGWFTAASVLCAAAPGIGWLIAARRAGHRRRADDTGQPGDHRGGLPAQRPHPRDRDVGRIQRGVRRDRALPGRVAAGSRQLAVDLPDQRPGRRGGRVDDPAPRPRIPGHLGRPGAPTGPARWPASPRWPRSPTRSSFCLAAGVNSPGFAAAAVLAVASSATFAVTERRRSHPMLPPAIFRPGAVPRRECRHLRRQRRPRRLRVRLHPRPGDHRRLQPGGGGLGTGAGHRRDLAAVGSQRPAGCSGSAPGRS